MCIGSDATGQVSRPGIMYVSKNVKKNLNRPACYVA